LLIGHTDEQSDATKSQIGRFLIVIFLAATSVIAGVPSFRGAIMATMTRNSKIGQSVICSGGLLMCLAFKEYAR
jgi:hypothetical protein